MQRAAEHFLAATHVDIDTLAQHITAQGVWYLAPDDPQRSSVDVQYGRSVLAQLWFDLGIAFLQRGVADERPARDYIAHIHMTVQGHTNRYHSDRYLRERSATVGPLWQPTLQTACGLLRAFRQSDAEQHTTNAAVFVTATERYCLGLIACGDYPDASFLDALRADLR